MNCIWDVRELVEMLEMASPKCEYIIRSMCCVHKFAHLLRFLVRIETKKQNTRTQRKIVNTFIAKLWLLPKCRNTKLHMYESEAERFRIAYAIYIL